MKKVTQVTVVRAEGPSDMCGEKFSFNSLEAANKHLSEYSWSYSVGYDKHDVSVTWEDGEEYCYTACLSNPSSSCYSEVEMNIGARVFAFCSHATKEERERAHYTKEQLVFMDAIVNGEYETGGSERFLSELEEKQKQVRSENEKHEKFVANLRDWDAYLEEMYCPDVTRGKQYQHEPVKFGKMSVYVMTETQELVMQRTVRAMNRATKKYEAVTYRRVFSQGSFARAGDESGRLDKITEKTVTVIKKDGTKKRVILENFVYYNDTSSQGTPAEESADAYYRAYCN